MCHRLHEKKKPSMKVLGLNSIQRDQRERCPSRRRKDQGYGSVFLVVFEKKVLICRVIWPNLLDALIRFIGVF